MHIQLKDEEQKRIIYLLKQHFSRQHDEEISDLKATLLLDFMIDHLGSAVYNQAIQDAVGFMQDKLIDLDSELHKVPKR